MDFIRRKISLSRYLVSYDSDNDGINDALTLSATTKVLQIPLTHTYDDMGIFDVLGSDDQDLIDVIDVSGLWDESNDGSGDITPTTSGDFESDFGGGALIADDGVASGSIAKYSGCIDPTATNFSQELYDISLTTLVDNYGCEYAPTLWGGGLVSGYDTTLFTTTYSNECPNISGVNNVCGGCIPEYGGVSDDNDLWVTETWSNYSISTALIVANQKCQELFGPTSGVRETSDFTAAELTNQGDCSNVMPFPGVKLKNTETDTCCVNPGVFAGTCVSGLITSYRHEFCFWCK